MGFTTKSLFSTPSFDWQNVDSSPSAGSKTHKLTAFTSPLVTSLILNIEKRKFFDEEHYKICRCTETNLFSFVNSPPPTFNTLAQASAISQAFYKVFFRTVYNLHFFLHSNVPRIFPRHLALLLNLLHALSQFLCSLGSSSDLYACFINIQRINCYRCSKLMHCIQIYSKSQ